VAITLWRDEYAIVTALDDLGEVRIELYECATARELCAAEVLEPELRTLNRKPHRGGWLSPEIARKSTWVCPVPVALKPSFSNAIAASVTEQIRFCEHSYAAPGF
jgi:hypothetical protein